MFVYNMICQILEFMYTKDYFKFYKYYESFINDIDY